MASNPYAEALADIIMGMAGSYNASVVGGASSDLIALQASSSAPL